jgi:hypothetical protein
VGFPSVYPHAFPLQLLDDFEADAALGVTPLAGRSPAAAERLCRIEAAMMEVANALAATRCNDSTGNISLYEVWKQAARRCAAER